MYGSGPSPRVPDSVMFTVVVDYSTNTFPVPGNFDRFPLRIPETDP